MGEQRRRAAQAERTGTTRSHCEKPDACTATGRGHCRRCALKVNAAGMAAVRVKGGSCVQAVLRRDPAFVERLRDAARQLAAGLNRDRAIVERRAETMRRKKAAKLAASVGIPACLVDEYRLLRRRGGAGDLSRDEVVAVLVNSYPQMFKPERWREAERRRLFIRRSAAGHLGTAAAGVRGLA